MKFGTSGLRGLVTDLQGLPAFLYATAFAEHLLEAGLSKPGDKIYVAGDHRPSTPDIMATCLGALERSGLAPIDCGAIPTPALALYAMTRSSASLMVTGSHIPADRNGIKFYRPDGEITKADEEAINHIASNLRARLMGVIQSSAPREDTAALAQFLDRYRALLPARALEGLTVGVYQHSTVARDALATLLVHYGAKVVALGRSDEFIPVDTEAVSPETLALLKAWAKEHKLDAIVSADGDGDRPLVADEAGQPLRGDLLGVLVANFLKAKVVATPVTSNSGIETAGNFRVVRTRVGSPFVIEAMNDALKSGQSAVMGFEANGGVLTATNFQIAGSTLAALPTRDSFLPILATLYLRASERKPLSAIAASFHLPIAAADRLENFPAEASAALMAHLRADEQNLADWLKPIGAVSNVSDIDGLRVTLEDGRIIHLRPSGNAPEMRCYVEARDEEMAQQLLRQGLELARKWVIGDGSSRYQGG